MKTQNYARFFKIRYFLIFSAALAASTALQSCAPARAADRPHAEPLSDGLSLCAAVYADAADHDTPTPQQAADMAAHLHAWQTDPAGGIVYEPTDGEGRAAP